MEYECESKEEIKKWCGLTFRSAAVFISVISLVRILLIYHKLYKP